MIKVDQHTLHDMEARYPGITSQIMHFENQKLPACEVCGSPDTADVQIGIIGRTIHLAAATSKFALIPNPPRPGRYRCNTCDNYFGKSDPRTDAAAGFTLRPRDTSPEGMRRFAEEIVDRVSSARKTRENLQ